MPSKSWYTSTCKTDMVIKDPLVPSAGSLQGCQMGRTAHAQQWHNHALVQSYSSFAHCQLHTCHAVCCAPKKDSLVMDSIGRARGQHKIRKVPLSCPLQ